METGFIPDMSYAAILSSSWVEGEPAKGFLGNIKLGGKRRIAAKTFRCTKCGYLESYARS
jgi:hypothetical protein